MSAYLELGLVFVTLRSVLQSEWGKFEVLGFCFPLEGTIFFRVEFALGWVHQGRILLERKSLVWVEVLRPKWLKSDSIPSWQFVNFPGVNSLIFERRFLLPSVKLLRLAQRFIFVFHHHGMFIDIKYFMFDFWLIFFVLFEILIDFLMTVNNLSILVKFLLEDRYFLMESFPILGEVVGAGYVKGGVLGGSECRLDFLLVGMDF